MRAHHLVGLKSLNSAQLSSTVNLVGHCFQTILHPGVFPVLFWSILPFSNFPQAFPGNLKLPNNILAILGRLIKMVPILTVT